MSQLKNIQSIFAYMYIHIYKECLQRMYIHIYTYLLCMYICMYVYKENAIK